MIQETVSLDGLLDRLISKRIRSDQILNIVNNTFTKDNLLTKDDIKKRKTKTELYKQQLQLLLKQPKVEQRTEEWFAMRKTLITASEFAQALGKGKFGTQKQFFQKKCGHEEEKPFNVNAPALKWGTMYEPVACEIYSKRTYQTVHEFGLLRHPTIQYFGASPDGITNNGVMLEIKCPYQRKITGEVPLQYYYQIQGQLSVCDLYECDYTECDFHEYDTFDSWQQNLEKGQEAGVVLEDCTTGKYTYSPIYTKDDYPHIVKTWIDTHTNEDDSSLVKMHFWTLHVFNIVRVYRDDTFLKNQFMLLDTVWNKVCMYKEDIQLYKHDINTITYKKTMSLPLTDEKEYGGKYLFLED